MFVVCMYIGKDNCLKVLKRTAYDSSIIIFIYLIISWFKTLFCFDLSRCPQEFCLKLKTMSKEERERLHIRDELLSGEPEVDCFLDDMNSFYLVSAM